MIYKKRVVIVNDDDLATDISSAQEAADGAAQEEQRIYYRSKVGITPYGAALPTTWINNKENIYNNTATVPATSGWTTKITPIARTTGENEEKYLYLYTCLQKRTVSGEVTYTDILLDDTTTVIDGGTIVTGSVTANKLNALDINASRSLTVGALTEDAADSILNSKILIGGRNLLSDTATPETLTTAANQNWFKVPIYRILPSAGDVIANPANTQITFSFDYSITNVDTIFDMTVSLATASGSYGAGVVVVEDVPIGSSSGHATATRTITSAMRQYAVGQGIIFSGSGNNNANAQLLVVLLRRLQRKLFFVPVLH